MKHKGKELGELMEMALSSKALLTETKSRHKLHLKAYFDGRMSVEHVF